MAALRHCMLPQIPPAVSNESLGSNWRCSDYVWAPAPIDCSVPQFLSTADIERLLEVRPVTF